MIWEAGLRDMDASSFSDMVKEIWIVLPSQTNTVADAILPIKVLSSSCDAQEITINNQL